MLEHQFCGSWVSVCSKFVEMNQIIITQYSVHVYAICDIDINDNCSKYFAVDVMAEVVQ